MQVINFVPMAPMGQGNSGDFDLFLYTAWVYAKHCREIFMALPKAQLTPPAHHPRSYMWN